MVAYWRGDRPQGKPQKLRKNMNNTIVISGNHIDLTAGLKDHVTDKMSRLFNHNQRIIRLNIELCFNHTRDKQKAFVAKGHVSVNGPDIEGSVESDDLYKSIDLLVDKLDRQIARRHEKHKDKRNHPHAIELPAALPKVFAA
jgi:putative sigma-54 modulation protein